MTQVCFERLVDTGSTPGDFSADFVIFEGNLVIYVCSKILKNIR